MTDKTVPQQLTPWKPGQSGNPAGRPKGSRNKINELFLQDFYEAWEALGRPALLATAWLEPQTFVKVAAALLPKEFKVETSFADLTDEQRRTRIRELSERIGLGTGASRANGSGGKNSRARAAEGKPH